MSETAVLTERLTTHIEDSTERHRDHEKRLAPLEDFMKETRNDVAWIKKIGSAILFAVSAPWIIKLLELIKN